MQNNNSKINTILLVVLIIIALFCAWKLVDKNNYFIDEYTHSTNQSGNDIVSKEEPKEYENEEYNFYVDIPEVSVSKEEFSSGKYPAIRYEVRNVDGEGFSITIPKSASDWRIFLSARTYIGDVTNGKLTFEHWILEGEFGTGNYYVIERDGVLYEISTSNQEDLVYFGFIN